MKPPKGQEPDFEHVLLSERLRRPFHEFLEQQFCAENLNFYLFVERYKAAGSDEERARMGKELFNQHFAESAAEPVNVESSIMRVVKEAVSHNEFRPDLFNAAQYHVFHIMKFDVWPRFQKSDASGANTLDQRGSSIKKKEAAAAAAAEAKPEAKRKSLLPWKVMRGRKKESSASTPASSGGSASARGGNPTPASAFLAVDEDEDSKRTGWRQIKQHSMPSQIVEGVKTGGGAGSGSVSGRSSDAGLVLSGSAPSTNGTVTTVLVDTEGNRETLTLSDPALSARDWLRSICTTKGLDPAHTELLDHSGEVLLAAKDSGPGGPAMTTLGNRTLRLSRLVEFHLEIPVPAPVSPSTSTAPQGSGKTEIKQVLVQARAESRSGSVLRNVVRKYGLELESLVVGFAGTSEVLPSSALIAEAANRRLFLMSQAQFNGGEARNSPNGTGQRFPSMSSGSSRAPSPAFSPFPAGGGAMAEIGSKPASSLLVPGKPKAVSLDGEDGRVEEPSLGQGHASASNPSLPPAGNCEEPGMLKHVKKATGGAPLALRKSLQPSSTSHQQHHTKGEQPAAKRQTLANSQDLRNQMKQDTALSELMSRTSQRMEDQTVGGAVRKIELPEFLRPKEPAAADESFESGSLPPDACRSLDMVDTDGTLATPSKAEAVFGRAGEGDFADPEFTSRRNLAEFGLGSATSSADGSFVTAPSSADVSTSGEHPTTARPLPPYPGLGRLCATNLERGSRTPVLYLSPKGRPGAESTPTLLKADYV